MGANEDTATKLVVRNDLRKLSAIGISFVGIAICIGALAFTHRSNPVLSVICFIIVVVMLIGAAGMLRRGMNRDPLFVFDETGVTDYTKPDDVLSLPWSQVIGVQLKAANSNDLMLDVMGYKTTDEFDEVTPEMQQQLDANGGGNRVYYALELSGLWVRRARIREAYNWVKDHTEEAYPAIVFSEFHDPLSKLGKRR